MLQCVCVSFIIRTAALGLCLKPHTCTFSQDGIWLASGLFWIKEEECGDEDVGSSSTAVCRQQVAVVDFLWQMALSYLLLLNN